MSTQTQGVRGPPLRGYRRRKTMLDLNVAPSESRDQEETSSQDATRPLQGSQQGHHQHLPSATIDVEALDDDVIESSPRAFAEAKSNAQRNNPQRNRAQRSRGSAVVVDLDSGRTTRLASAQNKRRRVSPNQTVVGCDFINLESSSSSMGGNVQPLPPPPPVKEPTFNCPICMGPFSEETSTKCGHIFCKACIKTAIRVQSKCPTCRKKVTVKELIRVFLPATNSS